MWFWELNSGLQTWQQAPLHADPFPISFPDTNFEQDPVGIGCSMEQRLWILLAEQTVQTFRAESC